MLPRALSGELGETYVRYCLHDAVASAPASGWALSDDDARHVVALEVVQRLRTTCAPFFRQTPALFLDSNLLQMLGQDHTPSWHHTPANEGGRPRSAARVLDYVAGLVQADLAQEQGGSEYLGKLKRLQAGFALTQRELAELLKVRPQAIRKWFAGGGISPDVRAAIDIHLAQLQRLESHFQPGLLPSILRRPDRGLKGRRPIALVIAGKADEFADYVERVITDDRTA
jgi:DNA-binding XRE family transcriptional regulator